MNREQWQPPAASIQFLSGQLAGQTIPVTGSETRIGRHTDDEITLTGDSRISRTHLKLLWTGAAWRLERKAGSNRVAINGQDMGEAAPLQYNDTVALSPQTSFRFLAPQGGGNGARQPQPNPPVILGGSPGLRVPTPLPSWSGPQGASESFFTGSLPSIESDETLHGAGGTQQEPARGSGLVGVASLEVSSNTGYQRTFPLDQPIISLGRESSNDMIVSVPTVSGVHLQIEREGTGYVLVHPHPLRGETSNGLLYHGRKIRGNEHIRQLLVNGDTFRIGDERGGLVSLTFRDGSGVVQENLPPVRPIRLGAERITIGRADDNTVVLPHPQVSAHHAILVAEGGAYRIFNNKSTNGVYINEKPMRPTARRLLKTGDQIRIGPYRLVYETTHLTQFDESASIRIDALHLKKRGSKQEVLTNNISLSVPPRSFVALVGGSGAGKSTLLDELCGLRPAHEGQVLYNGRDYYKNMAAFSTQIGYVPQDDIVHRDLTVERALYYAAKLRLPRDFNKKQISRRIDEVLEDVDLTVHRGKPIKKLSGGQRKRVSIALELLANPSVLFLDEPTSGLDPGLDQKMMLLLRNLADKGHTIILVTHATANIIYCDYVCFLARGGRLVYFGPPKEANTYFSKGDFAQIYSGLEPTDDDPGIPEEAERKFRASEQYRKYVTAPMQRATTPLTSASDSIGARRSQRSNPWKQFFLLSMRYLELLRKDVPNLSLLLLQAPIIALLLDFFIKYHILIDHLGADSDADGPLFIMVVAAVWFGVINAAREIVKEAPIYQRERTVNLGLFPYVFSKVVILGILCAIQSVMLLVIVGFESGYPAHGILLPPFWEMYITLFLTAFSGLMLGLLVSAIVPNADRAMSVIPLLLVPQIIFSGNIFALSGAKEVISYIVSARWGLVALGSTNQLHHFSTCIKQPLLPPGSSPTAPAGDCPAGYILSTPTASGDTFYGHDVHHLLLAWGALLALSLVFLILTLLFQKRKDVRR